MSRAVLNARAFSACCWTLLPVTRRARILARSDMKRRSRFTSFQSTYSTRSVTSRLIFFLALRALSLFLVRTGLAIRRAPQRGRSRRDRKRVVKGKRGVDRVVLGGRRNIK